MKIKMKRKIKYQKYLEIHFMAKANSTIIAYKWPRNRSRMGFQMLFQTINGTESFFALSAFMF